MTTSPATRSATVSGSGWKQVVSPCLQHEGCSTGAYLLDPVGILLQAPPQRAGDWIERSGKRLAYIYATHGHGDHWFGTADLVRRFPGVTVYATPGTIEVMHSRPPWDARNCGTSASPA
ncbi:MBL fold metallo-hydrolase [Streptomyces sp. NBC_01589]|uniref:MBL fold metallo-hydrolase n=1 Tax=unclassified Streptomyces TaxID=2593676 RepID=UPI00386DC1F7